MCELAKSINVRFFNLLVRKRKLFDLQRWAEKQQKTAA